MTSKILIVLLLVCGRVKCQSRTDTIHVFIISSDTAYHNHILENPTLHYEPWLFQHEGYAIKRGIEIIEYLKADKTPFTDCVWMIKEIKK